MPESLQLLLAAIAGAVVTGVFSWFIHHLTTSRRTTIELILRHEVHDDDWIEGRLKAIEYLRSLNANDYPRVALDWSNRTLPSNDKTGLGHVVDWLNHLELVAIALRSRALNRKIYLDWQGSALKENWGLALPLIHEMRQSPRGDDSLFEALDQLVKTP